MTNGSDVRDVTLVIPTDELIAANPEAAQNGPLAITYYITSQLTVVTTVLGGARNVVNISIFSGSISRWSTSLRKHRAGAAIRDRRSGTPLATGSMRRRLGGRLDPGRWRRFGQQA